MEIEIQYSITPTLHFCTCRLLKKCRLSSKESKLLTPGRKNSITDVPGIHTGHFTLADGDTQTGVTAILPYPLSVRNRKLFIGSCARGNWNNWTGLQVAEDFGTFSSPIVLCNATTIGIAYDALISYGHQREKDLPIDNAWPPVVIGLDDGYLNDLRQRRIEHDDILRTIYDAKNGAMPCGSAGIGLGLCAFGGKGGVGDASRVVQVDDHKYTVAVFIAANGGRNFTEDTPQPPSSLTPSFVNIIATDAPLLPQQLRLLAEHSARALNSQQMISPHDHQLVLAFSTGNTIDGAFEDQFRLFFQKWPSRDFLTLFFDAAAECTLAALKKALQNAVAVPGKKGRSVQPVDLSILKF
jgi:D-aminopeptidase